MQKYALYITLNIVKYLVKTYVQKYAIKTTKYAKTGILKLKIITTRSTENTTSIISMSTLVGCINIVPLIYLTHSKWNPLKSIDT